MIAEGEFDYVIVGGGSAGCVLANRLSEDGSRRVVLIEAGDRDRNPWIHIPVGYFRTMHNPSVDWCYQTEEDPGLNGRRLDWPRGKVLGGSSSINGLLYVRGQPEDYDRWRQMGNSGWGWEDVFPLFRKAESFQDGENEFHGGSGPLSVMACPDRRSICDDWLSAAVAEGYVLNPDYNGSQQEGVGHFQVTVKNGRRCSAAVGYLRPAMRRANLRVITKAQVCRILFDGKRAAGVVYRDRSGADHSLTAAGEVILSAGAIGSPQLLMLSGIGDGESLRDIGIQAIADLPDVGRNMQDHLQARVVFKCTERTINDDVNSLPRRAAMAVQYAFLRTGPMSMAASFVVGFMRTGDHVSTPDVQFHVQPWSAESVGKGVDKFSAFTASVCQLRPESRGEIRLISADPAQHPAIIPNYLATETDCRTMVEGVRIARRIATHEPLRSKITEEYKPGTDTIDDEGIMEWIRNTSTTIFHPTGTCRMGQGQGAVVDARLRVRGFEGLRVADCSIMPEIVSGNTNAAAIMIGEKASNLVLDDARH
ncbi:MAG: choline dehydrogenase [Rhodobacteraceae bacterium]|nr:choline dehydrogenase [Paracoccaceae bacterium]